MRVVFAECSVDYSGRLDAHLEKATRLLMVKADGSVLVHADGGSYKPLNWMSPPCSLTVREPSEDEAASGVREVWDVTRKKSEDKLVVRVFEVWAEASHDLGVEPGLVKDGVEAHLQALLAEQVERIGEGMSLVRREYPTAIGPVDLLVRDGDGGHVAVEIKRRGEIDGVEQLTRYLALLERDPLLTPVRGVFAAQEIKPQARVLAEDRGIECIVLDYDEMRGLDNAEDRLF
jgi:Predicted nuclease of the RecB family